VKKDDTMREEKEGEEVGEKRLFKGHGVTRYLARL
jgi:hypothetical protein